MSGDGLLLYLVSLLLAVSYSWHYVYSRWMSLHRYLGKLNDRNLYYTNRTTLEKYVTMSTKAEYAHNL